MSDRRIGLQAIANESLLRRVWKEHVRPMLRTMTFSNLNLTPDPLHYAGYEWGLRTLVSSLGDDIILGQYSPERGEIVRMAKGKGLTRPLCFLAPRDALVYSAITSLCRAQLIAKAQPWVGAERGDKGQSRVPDDVSDSFDWFRFWLEREGRILAMLDDETVNYLVESDISNFFPSIRLDAIREHLHSQTNLEKEVVRLCVQIIDGVMPRRDYSEVSLMGLPQEQSGASRYIAHSLLIHVDKEFEAEGGAGRYTRFMDDVLIGAKTREEGQAFIARWQMSLETLGLYPNGAKTNVIEKSRYIHDAMVSTNAEIDRIENKLSNSTHGSLRQVELSPEIMGDIEKISLDHRALAIQPKRWDRVMRRIYTLHRRTGILLWWEYWHQDISEYPGSAPHILEYVRAWPLNYDTAQRLADISKRNYALYPNIALLAAETMMSAPIEKDEQLWARVYDICINHLRWLLTQSHRDKGQERIAAAWLLPAWKFGNLAQRHEILSLIPSKYNQMSPIRVQALPLLVAMGKSLTEWVAAKPGMAWENALGAEYLRSLEAGEDRAVGVVLSLLSPGPRLLPQRHMILPRALPLVEIVGRVNTDKLARNVPGILKKLEQNPDRLRDYRTESELAKWCR